MNKHTLPFAFRSASATDRNLILKSWLKTWRDEQQHLSNDSYYRQANQLFNTILDRFPAVVACNPEDPDQVYAFAVAAYINNEEWVCFWLQTKSLYSKLGIGTALFNFIKGERKHGPLCPFLRAKSKYYANKYDLLDAPMMLPAILAMPDIQQVEV
jgi:hypothetical protein